MVIIAYIYILYGNDLGYACNRGLLDMGWPKSNVETRPDQESIYTPKPKPFWIHVV